jgi:hypothetical protein
MSNNSTIDRQIQTIKFKPDSSLITIGFVEVKDVPVGNHESEPVSTHYMFKSKHRPHKDFELALRKLVDHGLKIWEIEDDNTEDYAIIGLKIAGDFYMNQSRVQLIIAKKVNRTGKIAIFPPSPQTTLSDESDYESWGDLKKLIEVVMKEAWLYIGGKHLIDDVQLSFSFDALPEKKEKKKFTRRKKADSKELAVSEEVNETLNQMEPVEETEDQSPLSIAN